MRTVLLLFLFSLGLGLPAQQDKRYSSPKVEKANKKLLEYVRAYHDSSAQAAEALFKVPINSDFDSLQTNLNLGMYFDNISDYDSSLYYLYQAKDIAERKAEYAEYKDLVYSALASTFSHSTNYQSALEWQKKAIAAVQEEGDLTDLYVDLSNLADYYMVLDQNDSAVNILERSLRLVPAEKIFDRAVILQKAANLAKNMGRHKEAIKSLQEALKLFEEIQASSYFLFTTNLSIVINHLAMDQVEMARRRLDICDSLLPFTNMVEMDMQLSFYKHEYYKKIGDFESALVAFRKYDRLQDSLDGVESQESINKLQERYKAAERENKIQAQDIEISKTENRFRIAGISALFALLVGLILAFYYNNSRKKSALLASQNLEIQAANAEIKSLMRESHHRIKNNLQVVSSLLKLQGRSSESPEVQASLSEAHNRVKTIALLHQKLQGSAQFSQVNIAEFLEQLCEAILHSLTQSSTAPELDLQVEPLELPTDKAISLGLMVNELITNAVKYAWPHTSAGKLSLHLRSEQDALRLTIADDGIGLPAEFNTDKLNSLGYKIVKGMAVKLDGNLRVENGDVGVRIELTFPHDRSA